MLLFCFLAFSYFSGTAQRLHLQIQHQEVVKEKRENISTEDAKDLFLDTVIIDEL